jgi:ABC-type nitrate/sulfonate/bicarbonate transport system permease component
MRVATGAAGLAGLLVAWQVAAVILGDQVALPSVSQTVAQFAHYLGRPYPAQGKPLWFDLYISLRRSPSSRSSSSGWASESCPRKC